MTQQESNSSSSMALTPRQQKMLDIRDNIGAGEVRPMAIVPRTFIEAQAFASALEKSDLIPSKLKERAGDILVIILAGAELGIAPMQSLRLHHVIEGVPRLSADGIASLVLASPECELLECTEYSDTRVTWVTKKRGSNREQSRTWTKERAVRAGLWDRKNRDGSPGNFQKYPERMLSARAKAELCRDVYPHICAGLISSEEAIDGAIDAEFVEVRSNTAAFAPVTPPPSSTPAAAEPAKKPASTKKKDPPVIDTTATETGKPAHHPDRAADEEQRRKEALARAAAPAVQQDIGKTIREPSPDIKPAPTAAASGTPAESSTSPTTMDTGSGFPPTSVDADPATSTAPASDGAPADTTAAGGDDDSGFGGEDPVDTPAPRTIDGFKRAVAACKSPTDLDRVKNEWMPWSMSDEGKPHARAMREAFATQKKELGL